MMRRHVRLRRVVLPVRRREARVELCEDEVLWVLNGTSCDARLDVPPRANRFQCSFWTIGYLEFFMLQVLGSGDGELLPLDGVYNGGGDGPFVRLD